MKSGKELFWFLVGYVRRIKIKIITIFIVAALIMLAIKIAPDKKPPHVHKFAVGDVICMTLTGIKAQVKGLYDSGALSVRVSTTYDTVIVSEYEVGECK